MTIKLLPTKGESDLPGMEYHETLMFSYLKGDPPRHIGPLEVTPDEQEEASGREAIEL